MKKRLCKVVSCYIYIICILFGLLVALPYNDIVSASYQVFSPIHFEDGVAGNNYENTTFYTENGATVSTTYKHGGTKSLYQTNGGYINFTTNNCLTYFFNYVRFWWSTDTVGSWFFYNRTLGKSESIIILYWSSSGTNANLYYRNEVNGSVSIGSGNNGAWNSATLVNRIYFNITNELGDVNYGLYIGSAWNNKTGVARHPEHIADGYIIDCIYFSLTSMNFYTDDWTFIMSTFYGTGEGGGECDFSLYDSIGDNLYWYVGYNDQFDHIVRQYYHVPLTTTIVGVELAVTQQQYEQITDDINDYILYINSLYVGHPTEFISYGNGYMLKWCGLAVNLTNDDILFEFDQSGAYDSTYGYWQVGAFKKDGDGDGITEFSWGNSYGYGENVLQGMELSYRFWYDSITVIPEEAPWDYENLTLTKTDYYVGETVNIQYYLTTFTYMNYIHVYHNSTEYICTKQGYPKVISSGSFGGVLTFIPLYIGEYNFKLVRNSVVIITSVNITVTYDDYQNMLLFAYPNPCPKGENFNLGYKYYNPSGGEGLMLLGYSQSMKNVSDSVNHWNILSNSSGNITLTASSNYWAILFYSNAGTYYYVRSVYIRISALVRDSSIDVLYDNIYLDPPNVIKVIQRILGYHKFIGGDVEIYINNKFIADVGDNNYFNVSYEVTDEGFYYVYLYSRTMNGSILLATTSFTVTMGGAIPSYNIWEGLFGDYKYVFAIGIIFTFIIFPMTIASRMGIDLPLMVNLGSGALGLSFCILSGMLDLWVAFLVVVISVVGALVVIFR